MTPETGGLPAKMRVLHQSLTAAGIDHAFGGALALAWCTHQARGTIDLDLNLFVGPDRANDVLAGLAPAVGPTGSDLTRLERDGQVRLWWDATPIDLFLNTTEFHEEIGSRVRWEPFDGALLPFLACQDLAVFKAFFDRTKDWADLEAMAEAGTLDTPTVAGVLARYLGPDDQRVARLLGLT